MEREINPTPMQIAAADDMLRQGLTGEKINKGEAIRKAGYSESAALRPKSVTEKKGFKQYLRDAGLSEENLASYLAEDIKNKPLDRVQEMKLAAELMGLKDTNLNVNIKNETFLQNMKAVIDGELLGENE